MVSMLYQRQLEQVKQQMAAQPAPGKQFRSRVTDAAMFCVLCIPVCVPWVRGDSQLCILLPGNTVMGTFCCLLTFRVLQPQTETLGETGCWPAVSARRAPSTAAQTGRGPQHLATGAQACGTAQLNERGTGQQSAAGRGRETGRRPGSGTRLIWIGREAGMLEGGSIGAGALAAGGAAGTCRSSMLVPSGHGDGPKHYGQCVGNGMVCCCC
jgi:hypothetical protein